LVDGRRLRPGGFLPDTTGASKGTVFLLRGNRWHGFPEGHPRFNEVTCVWNKNTGLYEEGN